jgi:site-specific DNA-methyltransferase (adenine-specific)/site-specific DNA-methyltransferase (cytosine-N4-specific)
MDLVLAMVRKWGWRLVDEFCWERVGVPGSWPNRFRNGFEPVYHFSKEYHIRFFPQAVRNEVPGSYSWAGVQQSTGAYFNTDRTSFEWEGSLPSNRVPVPENTSGLKHEAAFPWKLPLWFILAFSEEGDTWCDPFTGSGSTQVAAAKVGRRSIGIENIPKNCSEAIARLTAVVGQEARRT